MVDNHSQVAKSDFWGDFSGSGFALKSVFGIDFWWSEVPFPRCRDPRNFMSATNWIDWQMNRKKCSVRSLRTLKVSYNWNQLLYTSIPFGPDWLYYLFMTPIVTFKEDNKLVRFVNKDSVADRCHLHDDHCPSLSLPSPSFFTVCAWTWHSSSCLLATRGWER